MNFRPLCTAMVCPTISGTTVDRRDQVLMTFFSLSRFIASTFSRRCRSMNGPFLSDLPMMTPSSGRLLLPPLEDEPLAALVAPRLVPLGGLSPRRHRMPAACGLALTTAERMIDRVHRHTADVRPPAEPAAATGLADRHVLVVDVAHLPDRCPAL